MLVNQLVLYYYVRIGRLTNLFLRSSSIRGTVLYQLERFHTTSMDRFVPHWGVPYRTVNNLIKIKQKKIQDY